jgi:hypothetical protein
MCEGTECLNAALSSGMTNQQVVVVHARSVGWGSNEAMTLLYLVPYQSALLYSMQTQVSEYSLSTPLTRISIDVADRYLEHCVRLSYS